MSSNCVLEPIASKCINFVAHGGSEWKPKLHEPRACVDALWGVCLCTVLLLGVCVLYYYCRRFVCCSGVRWWWSHIPGRCYVWFVAFFCFCFTDGVEKYFLPHGVGKEVYLPPTDAQNPTGFVYSVPTSSVYVSMHARGTTYTFAKNPYARLIDMLKKWKWRVQVGSSDNEPWSITPRFARF